MWIGRESWVTSAPTRTTVTVAPSDNTVVGAGTTKSSPCRCTLYDCNSSSTVRDGESKVTLWLSSLSVPLMRVRKTTVDPAASRPGWLRTAVSLPSFSCLARFSALLSTVRTVRTEPSMSTVTGNARSTSTWRPSCRPLDAEGTTTSWRPSCTCCAFRSAPTVFASVRMSWREPSTRSVTWEPAGASSRVTAQPPPRTVATTSRAMANTRGPGRRPVSRRRMPGGGVASSRSSVTDGSASVLGSGSQAVASWGSARAGDGAEEASAAARASATTASASATTAACTSGSGSRSAATDGRSSTSWGSGSQAAASWGSARAGDGATAASSAARSTVSPRSTTGVASSSNVSIEGSPCGSGTGSHAAGSCGSARAGDGPIVRATRAGSAVR